jgi:CRISPR-associated protein Cas2
MLVLIMYDVNTTSKAGVKRLSRVSKICLDYGHRVQNSVYECEVDSLKLAQAKTRLLNVINIDEDSLRIYKIGNNAVGKVEHFGIKPSLDFNGYLEF